MNLEETIKECELAEEAVEKLSADVAPFLDNATKAVDKYMPESVLETIAGGTCVHFNLDPIFCAKNANRLIQLTYSLLCYGYSMALLDKENNNGNQ